MVVTRDPARDPRKKPASNDQPTTTLTVTVPVSAASTAPTSVAKVSPTTDVEKAKSPVQDVEMKEIKQEPVDLKESIDKKKKSKKRSKHDERRHKSPDRIEKKRRIDESHIQPTVAPGAHAFLPPPAVSMNSAMASMSLVPPVIAPVKPEIEDSWRRPNMPPSVITNETPTIGFNTNNRIFVDGRAYEVSFV